MNCLKCGRTVPDQILLCPECLSKKDSPAQTKIEPLQEELQKEQIKKLRRKLRRLRQLLALFVLLALAAAAMLMGQWHLMLEQNSRIESQTSRINSLETAMQEIQSELEQANALNDTMKNALADARQTMDQYQTHTGLSPEEIAAVSEEPQ